jgi:hypothetical protein
MLRTMPTIANAEKHRAMIKTSTINARSGKGNPALRTSFTDCRKLSARIPLIACPASTVFPHDVTAYAHRVMMCDYATNQ